MTDRAYKVWEAFKNELIQPATDNMREALATAFRVCGGLSWDDEDLRPSWEILEELAEELEK
jgi:hypothetical protein